jgi:hypothetical protein
MNIGILVDAQRLSSPIRRLSSARSSWRVVVQTWPDQNGFHGRIVFEADGARPARETREGPADLSGSTREDVVRSAHELPEDRLRALLHSLS